MLLAKLPARVKFLSSLLLSSPLPRDGLQHPLQIVGTRFCCMSEDIKKGLGAMQMNHVFIWTRP